MPGFSFYYSLPYSFKTGPLTEPRARLVTYKSQAILLSLHHSLGVTGVHGHIQTFEQVLGSELLTEPFLQPLSKAFEILRFCCGCCCFGLS